MAHSIESASRRAATAGLLLLTAALLLPRAVSAQTVRGDIADAATHAPIGGAELRLLDAKGEPVARAAADSAGAFHLGADAPGEYTLAAEAFGYTGVSHRIRLRRDEEVRVEVRLAPRAVALDPVVVVGRKRVAPHLREFHERAELNKKMGRGRIYDREDLDRMGPVPVRHILATVPTRNCRLSAFVDGLPMDLDYVREHQRADDLDGLEVYRTAMDIPPRYYRPGMCGAVFTWSRIDRSERPFSWWRVLVAGGILTGMFLLR
jgi:hypothetical protein